MNFLKLNEEKVVMALPDDDMKLKLNIKPVIKSKTKYKSLGGIPSSKYIEDMPNEIWKSLEEFPNYMFSNYGRIKNISLNILMSESRDSDGYVVIGLRNKKGRCTRRIHKIIATLFCDNPNNYTTVNHINHIRHDNRADNLEWCDLKDNIREQEHGLSSLSKSIKYTKTDGSVIVFESITEAAEYFGVTRANIRHRLKNPIVQRIKSNWLQGGSITYNN